MPNYVVFGGVLSSPLEFPQLPAADHAIEPTWTIVETDIKADSAELEFLGENQITPKAKVRLFRHASGFRLVYDDSGSFDIDSDGHTIRWAHDDGAEPTNVREDILGPVLAVAMHQSGRLCLHGSSVVLSGGAISFLAPKHYGKSTIALALMERGAQLLTDDSIPVDPGPPAMASPGVASVRFWEDTRNRFHNDGKTITGAGGKKAATDLAARAQLFDSQPLRAIYLLAPFMPGEKGETVFRRRVSSVESAMALVQHAKIGALLGKTEGPVLLDRATAIANAVPVYVLGIERNLDSLDTVVNQLFEWTAND